MNYYDLWKNNKGYLSLIPAGVFWAVSVVFFMVGLKFENTILIYGVDVSQYIAISIAVSNTIVQVIGNEQEWGEADTILRVGWVGSYALGIGTNVVGLLSILSIGDSRLEFIIAGGLGAMIEILPEKLLVQFLKGLKKAKSYSQPTRQTRPQNFTPSKKLRPEIDPHFPSGREKFRPIGSVTQRDMPFPPVWKSEK